MSSSKGASDHNHLMGGPFHPRIGDAAHLLVILSTILFAGSVICSFNLDNRTAHDDSKISNVIAWLFDPVWKTYGFCVARADTPYWSSHDLCWYVDTVAALLLTAVYWPNRKRPGMERPNELFGPGIAGLLFHGFGHAGLARGLREGQLADASLTEYEVMRSTPAGWTSFFFLLVFWFFLLKASIPNMSNQFIVACTVILRCLEALLPIHFGFTYFQTGLMLVFAINQLVRPQKEKDFHYTLYPIVVGLPLSFVGWIESTQCSAFVMDRLYGHLVYDAFIPCGMLLWYLLCLGRVVENSPHDKTASGKTKIKIM